MGKVFGTVFALCFLLEGWSFATTINVTTPQGNGCTVENAIASLNAGAGVGGCAVQGTGAFTINIPSGTFFVQGLNVQIQRSVTISGSSTAGTVVQFNNAGGPFGDPGLAMGAGLSVAVRNLTLRGVAGNRLIGFFNNGGNLTMTSVRVTAFGTGGISQFGTASLDSCTIDHNGAMSGFLGGGINYQGTGLTTIDRTSITSNNATLGGGIFSSVPDAGTVLRVTRSLIAQNTAQDQGGGIYSQNQFELINTTISGNSAQNHGGGIRFDASSAELHFRHCTIANNSASVAGGGLSVGAAGTPVVVYNIIAGNTAPSSPDIEWSRTVSAGAYNLIQSTSGWNQGLFPLSDGNKKNVNPQLQSLQNQGGPTSVRPIPTTSPAYNAIPIAAGDSSITTDQRGFSRLARGAYDMGAFEIQ